jgi:hypothetical protein
VDEAITGAWRRGWRVVPILVDAVPAELCTGRLGDLVVTTVAPPRAWWIEGEDLVMPATVERPCWRIDAAADATTAAGIYAATDRPRLVATLGEDRAWWIEAPDHVLLLAAPSDVELLLGQPASHLIAAFRERVEAVATDDGDEPPEQLLHVADRCGRLRLRSR